MFQLYKNIQTDFLGQIFLELFQFKTRSLFGDTQYVSLKLSFYQFSKNQHFKDMEWSWKKIRPPEDNISIFHQALVKIGLLLHLLLDNELVWLC